MDEARCRSLAATSPVARLGTFRAGGRLDLVPIVFAFHDDRLVFAVDHKPKSTTRLQRLANIAENPEVTVLFDHHEDDWDRRIVPSVDCNVLRSKFQRFLRLPECERAFLFPELKKKK